MTMEALVTHEISRQAVLLSNARNALERAETIPELRTLIDQSEVLRQAAKKIGLGLEAQNDWAIYRLDAMRKAGTALSGMDFATNHHETATAPTLGALGISDNQSSRWQRIASIPDPTYHAWADETRAAGEVTMAGALRLADGEPELDISDSPRDTTAMHSTGNDEAYTPSGVLDAIVAVLGEIDLDPCAEPAKHVPAREHFTKDDDGLMRPWHGRVFMNPPYSVVGKWMDKLADEYEAGTVTEAIALVAARTDTGWWSHFPATMVGFLGGRLRFAGHENGAPFASAVLYLGPNDRRFADVFLGLGTVYVRLEVTA